MTLWLAKTPASTAQVFPATGPQQNQRRPRTGTPTRSRPAVVPLRNPSANELVIIDNVFAPATCRALIDEADVDRWLTTTAEVERAANGPHTQPPRRVAEPEPERPPELVGSEDDERPRFAIIDSPVLALRLFYRLVASLPCRREDAELAGLKPLLRCVEYRRGEGTRLHRDPARETIDGHRSQLSVLVFLNDRFGGGGIEFPELGRRVEARAGRACVFSHGLAHIDDVVERGRKFVLETEVFYSSEWTPYGF